MSFVNSALPYTYSKFPEKKWFFFRDTDVRLVWALVTQMYPIFCQESQESQFFSLGRILNRSCSAWYYQVSCWSEPQNRRLRIIAINSQTLRVSFSFQSLRRIIQKFRLRNNPLGLWFDDRIFLKTHDLALLNEDKLLQSLSEDGTSRYRSAICIIFKFTSIPPNLESTV